MRQASKENGGGAHEASSELRKGLLKDRQKEEHTIATSQTAALRAFAQQQGFSVPDEWVIEDEGTAVLPSHSPWPRKSPRLGSRGDRSMQCWSTHRID